MADQTTESVLFEIKINSEQYKAEQALIRSSLQQLALDIEKTRASQKTLNDERKAGKVTDADYAQQSVKLREQLKGQTADQRELEKGLATSQKAYNSAAGSAEQLRAQLFELKTAYYAMSEAERQSTEGQGLQKQALAISDSLSLIEKSVGTASRDVGKYSDGFKQGLAGVVAELVKAQAAQKTFTEGSEAAAQNQIRVSGFLTAAQRAAAQAGITDFTQAKATIDQYTQAFTPAVEALVQIQQEQQQVGQTIGEDSEQYQQLGFKMAGAQKALDDLVAKAAKPILAPEPITAAAGSLAALRQQLIELQNTRETLDPTTKEAEELNTQILTLRTNIQQAEGKIDEFGERVQKNIKKENFDTVNDAIQGLVGTMSAATIVFGDNSDAAKAQAKALQLMALAQDARSIAIGIGSARDAVAVVLMQAKNLFLKEEATLTAAAAVSTEAHAAVAAVDATAIEAQAGAAALNAESQGASTAGTVANTAATEAQALATEKATFLQKLLNLVLRANPIGLVIIAIAALVAGFYAYNNASEKTQQKIKDITRAVLLFTNPLGLAYLGIEKLYQKFESVRKVLDPVINGFKAVAGAVGTQLRSFGEYIGLLDTAAEKAAKLAAAELERAQALREQTDAEIKALELAGATARQVTQERLASIELLISKQRQANETFKVANQAQLDAIKTQIAAGKELSDKQKSTLKERQKGELDLINLINQQQAAVNEGAERDRAARQQAAADIETNAGRASQNLQRRIEQDIAAEQATRQRRLATITLQLSYTQQGTLAELELQKKKVQVQRDLEIDQLTRTLAEKERLRAAYYPTELKALNQQSAQALEQFGLTEQQKTEITADYAQKRVDLEQKYSTLAARQAVAQIPLLRAQANAAQLKLEVDFQRQSSVVALQALAERNAQELSLAKQGTVARRDLELKAIDLEQELAIAGLDKQAMSNLDYETKVTAIRRDAIEKRRALSQQDTQDVITELQAQQQGAELNQQKLLAGQNEGQQLRIKASHAYYNEVLRAEIDNYTAGTVATKEGTTERENVEKQHAINLANIERDSNQAQLELIQAKYEKIAAITTSALSSLSTIQDAASQQRINQIDAEINAETTSVARKAVLEKQKSRIEAQAAEQRRKIAKAEAIVNLGAAVLQILKSPTAPFIEPAATIVRIAEIAAVTATAYAQFRSIDSQKFASGGIAYGPSHAQGGIQLHRRGQPVGIEIEGGEPILTAGVSRNKTLLSMASMINQLAGGRPLYVDPTPASTWARWADGGVVSSSAMYLPQVRTGGVVQQATPVIDYDQLGRAMAQYLTPSFIAGAQALPVPETNIVELRRRNAQLDKRDAETNI